MERKAIPGELNGRFSPFLRRMRMKAVRPFLRPGQRILDIGCGLYCWEGLLPDGCTYVGVDRETEVITENRQRSAHKFLAMDIEKPDWSRCGEVFDLVIMLAVVEHLQDAAALLRGLWPHLAGNAAVVLTTPHPAGNCLMRVGEKLGLLSDDKDEHEELLDRNALERIAADGGGMLAGYRRFFLGMNQLGVIRTKKDGPTLE